MSINQIKLYNDMVEKEGTEGEEEAKKAYKAARMDSDQAAEMALVDKTSSALIDRVIFRFVRMLNFASFHVLIKLCFLTALIHH